MKKYVLRKNRREEILDFLLLSGPTSLYFRAEKILAKES